MYCIFIDTNIFLDFYRYNKNDNILNLFNEFKKYQKFLITTEQSIDEFNRNRDKTINDFIDILNSQLNTIYDKNFLSNLDGFCDYIRSIKEANKSIKKMIDKCRDLMFNVNDDPVNKLFHLSCHKIFSRTNEIIFKAKQRKYIGNPPVSNKYTCCDEIIWETLLENCKYNLIIISRDGTFVDNSRFLKEEYKWRTSKKLEIVSTISDAIRLLGNEPSLELENVESSIVVEKESYDMILKDSTFWSSLIFRALIELGGEAGLKDLYQLIYKILDNEYPDVLKSNKNIEATVRGILQRFCSNSKYYSNKVDLFRNVKSGTWAIKTDF